MSDATIRSSPSGPLVGIVSLFNVRAYGASPLLSAALNDEAFAAAFRAAKAFGGGLVYVPRGRYQKLASITIDSNYVGMIGEGDASILDYSGVSATLTAIVAAGSQGAGVPLLADAPEGSDDLNVSGVGFSTDDWVKVYSTAVTGSTNIPKGEIGRVSDSATMTLYDPLCDSYTVATAAAVAKLTLLKGLLFSSFRIEGPSDGTVLFSGILLNYCENPRVDNVTFRRCHFYGLALQDTVFPEVKGINAGDSNSGSLAYGVAMFNAVQDATITGCSGFRLRHLVTHGGFSFVAGVPRRTVTSNCSASQMRNSGFDAHAGGEDLAFNNCAVLGSESDGFTIECASAVLNNCTVRDSVGPGFHLNPQTLKPFSIALNNCRVSGKGYSASRSAIQLQVNAGFESFDGIAINGGSFSDCRYGLRTINAQVGRITNLSITGGSYKQCGLDGDAVIGIVHAQGVSVTGVCIEDTTNSLDGISLTDVVESSVRNNTIRLTGSGGCRGVRYLTTCNIGSVGGNTIDTGASGIGIGIDNATTNITVGNDNDVRGCPTGYSFGTGTGHVFNQPPAVSADRGDLDIALTHNDSQTQRFNTPLTSNADITLPTANVRMRFRVVRQAGATGAFNVNIAALKSLTAAGQWADVESDGSNYTLVAAGSL